VVGRASTSAFGPSRHFAPRINYVALGGKRTSASVHHTTKFLGAPSTNQDQEHLGGRGLTYGAEIAADLDFKIRE